MIYAQASFGPTRLDDSLAQNYFYPTLSSGSDGSLLSTWSFFSDSLVGAYGQHMNLGGDWTGARISYDVMMPQGYLCPPQLTVMPTADGGEIRLINHS